MKKIIIIFIVIFVLLGGGAFLYFKMNAPAGTTKTGDTGGFKSFFSFNNDNQNSNNPDDKGGEVLPNDTGTIPEGTEQEVARLKQITDFAVAGLATFMDTRPSIEPVIPQVETKTEEAVAEEVPAVDPKLANVPDPKSPTKKVDSKTKTTPEVPKIEIPKVDIVPALRFVARSNGHIYEQYLDTKASGKISNTTIPTIHEAVFAKEGQFIVYRYLNDMDETIQSFFGTLGGETSGGFLPENIESVSTAPSGAQFFYLVPIGNDIAGYLGSFTNSKKTQIFTSAFTEWIPQWAQPNTIFLTTKPSYLFKGSLYAINKKTNAFTKVFGGIKGLTTLASSTGNGILYTNTSNGTPMLGVYNITSHSFSPLGISTITDKCVWSQDGITAYCGVPNSIQSGQYPDAWYQGIVTFNDSIVKIDTANLSSITIMDTEEINALDATNLTLSPDEKTLFMINKKDSTLWSLDL
jgi:hypothetical protein